MVERTVTAALLIDELCKELRMTEEQLFIHLTLEHYTRWLSARGQRAVETKARVAYTNDIFVVER